MILSPNEIPNCVLWLDASDLSTMYQQVSVDTRRITSAQNMIRYSDVFFYNFYATSDFSFNQSQTNFPLELNSTILPNGLSGWAGGFQENSQNTTHSMGTWDNRYLLPVGTYTYSFYMRSVSTNRLLQITIGGSATNDATITINPLLRSVFGTPSTGLVSYTIGTPDSRGWYRVSLTFNTVLNTSISVNFALLLTTGVASYLGNWESVLLWGAQLESGSVATVYKPTQDIPLTTPPYHTLIERYSPVATGSLPVRYWQNKSLSADFYGLSGASALPRNYNNWGANTMRLLPWSNQLSGIHFKDGPFLTAYSREPINVEEETVFFVGISDTPEARDIAWYSTCVTQASSAFPMTLTTLHTNTVSAAPFAHFAPLVVWNCWDGGTDTFALGPGVSYSVVNYYAPGNLNWNGHLDWYYNVGGTRNVFGGWGRNSTTGPFTYTVCKSGNIIENLYNGVRNETYSPIMSGSGNQDRRTNVVGPFKRTPHPTFPVVDLFRFGADYCPNMSLFTGYVRGSWTSAFYRAFAWTYQRTDNSRTCEVIVFNRRLTKDEIEDVNYYIHRKWPNPSIRRPVYALSNGDIGNSLIFSISSEPSPWNVVLSSDRVFTNGYTLTANTNFRCESVTNNNCFFNTATGGHVVLTQNAVLTANAIGHANNYSGTNTPGYVLFVPPNSSVTFQGNIYGGGVSPLLTTRALGWGAVVSLSGTLNLRGSVYAGWGFGSYGIYTSGGYINISPGNIVRGSGGLSNARWDYPHGDMVTTHSAGISAINTQLTFNNIEFVGGNLAPGMWCINSSITLSSCVLTNGQIHNSKNNWTWSGRNFRAPWCFTTPLLAESCDVKAYNSLFTGVTAGAAVYSAEYLGIETGAMFLNCKNYFKDCNVRNLFNPGRLNQDMWDSRNVYERYNASQILANPEYLWLYNSDVGGSGLFFRNCQISAEGIRINVGSTTDTNAIRTADAIVTMSDGSVGYFNNCTVNSNNETGGMGILVTNNSTLFLTGDVFGSGKGNQGECYGIFCRRGNIVIQGSVRANSAGGPGLYVLRSNNVIQIRGAVYPSYVSTGVYSFPPLTAYYSEPLLASPRGFLPITARQCQYISLCSNSLFTSFTVNNRDNRYVTYRDSSYTLDYPVSSNVLKGVTYGTLGYEQTGTSIIPEPSATIFGVPVRATYGTALPLTVDAFWNQPITNVQQNNTNIFTKLITPFTVQALSAIVPSLDYPGPTTK